MALNIYRWGDDGYRASLAVKADTEQDLSRLLEIIDQQRWRHDEPVPLDDASDCFELHLFGVNVDDAIAILHECGISTGAEE